MAKKTTRKKVDQLKENHCPVPAGTLVIIGGKENKGEEGRDNVPNENFICLEVLEAFVQLIKKKNPTIEVVTSATSEAAPHYREYEKLFRELGAGTIRQIHHTERREVLENDLKERIDEADAIYFTGGDQLILTSLYGGTDFLTLLKKKYIKNNFIVGGTSAGAMALSTPMIFAGSKDAQETAGEIKITTGLEFLKDVCIDTHFVERGRFVRMAQVIVTNPTSIGMGVEEDTALIVRNGLEAEVVGSGTVIIIDGLTISESNIKEFTDKKAISIRNIRVHILGRGDKYIIPQVNPPHK